MKLKIQLLVCVAVLATRVPISVYAGAKKSGSPSPGASASPKASGSSNPHYDGPIGSIPPGSTIPYTGSNYGPKSDGTYGTYNPPGGGSFGSRSLPTVSTYQYQGKLAAVNASAKTITVQGKKDSIVILVTTDTKIRGKDGRFAKLQELKIGDDVSGISQMSPDQKRLIAVTVVSQPVGR